jgi:hypothetical protein
MKKANKPAGAAKPAQQRPAQKKLATKPTRPKDTQRAAGLAEVVAQLALSAEKLALAADRLADATARLSVTGEEGHEGLETPRQSPADSTTRPQESEAADATDDE